MYSINFFFKKKAELFCVIALCICTFSQFVFICKYWWMFLYIRNIHDDALLYYYPKIGPGYVGATWPSWCYTHHMHWKRHRAVYDTHTMKRLLCLEFKLSQGTCVLEKLLIMPRHFILQFPELPSARKWTAVPPNRTLKLKKKRKNKQKKKTADWKLSETSSVRLWPPANSCRRRAVK